MRLLLGASLGAGLLLIAAPWLWPTGRRTRTPRPNLLAERLARAGLAGVPLRTLVALSVLSALTGGGLAVAMTGVPAYGLLAGVVALAIPAMLAASRAAAARRAARSSWPDLIDHLVASLRAGIPLPEAVAALAAPAPAAYREAFASFGAGFRATGDAGLCLDELKERLADPVADRLIETLRMAREVGGTELVGVLRTLGSHLRQEAAARSEIDARQSWVRGAARLGVAAPWVVLALLSTRAEAAAAYASPQGVALLAGALAVSVVAYRLMLAAGRLPEERRWFR
ncbi:type II secretion system F family protein [Naasia sp. SYSU D00948]|uniref:type II secretion system F family protein n=1 Tax=Naasia sp. SYSU D00948 TaxID=2817379 RepID=UPI001B30322F|nr:type II secretion system F family protein [Naasia sp. SYSU D00948]